MPSLWETFALCFAPANLLYTLLLILLVLYWIGVILGGLDISWGTPDLDLNADLDADLDIHIHGTGLGGIGLDHGLDYDHDIHADGHAPLWVSMLKFFNVGDVPLMVYLSFFLPLAWLFSMTLTERFGLSGSWLSGLALALPVLLAAAFAAKFVTWPLCKFFRAINREVGLVNREPILGRDAVVLTLAVDEHYGQAEIRGAGAPILLHVRAHPGQRFQRGDIVRIEALLDDEHDIYRVER